MDDIEELKKWNELKEAGIITVQEFDKKKKSILSGSGREKVLKKAQAKNYNLWQIYLDCFKNYFVAEGRASRYEFWGFILVDVLVTAAAVFVELISGLGLSVLYSLGSFVPRVTVSIRRLHDINRRGWWLLLPAGVILLSFVFSTAASVFDYAGMPLEPRYRTAFYIVFGFAVLFSVAYVFYLLCKKSRNEDNRFGLPADEDKGRDRTAVIIITLFILLSVLTGLSRIGI